MTRGVKLAHRVIDRRTQPSGQPGVFHVPACDRCGAWLCDEHGQPRWHVTFDVAFVCLGGCPPDRRKAGLS